jgi:hypothetical protein
MTDTLFDLEPQPPIIKRALLSADGLYRFRLDRDWDPSRGRVCWIMLNPSTADAEQDDATIRRCLRFTRDWGYGALTVVNLFAYRATDPRELSKVDRPIGGGNAQHLLAAVTEAPLAVAAWGASIPPLYSTVVAGAGEALRTVHDAHVLGLTARGAPRHPLYMAASSRPVLWKTLGDT